jgi:hypothetical protein
MIPLFYLETDDLSQTVDVKHREKDKTSLLGRVASWFTGQQNTSLDHTTRKAQPFDKFDIDTKEEHNSDPSWDPQTQRIKSIGVQMTSIFGKSS